MVLFSTLLLQQRLETLKPLRNIGLNLL